MDTPRPGDPELRAALETAITLAGSEEKLAKRIGYTQPGVNKARKRGFASPQMALLIDAKFSPAVTKAMLRPDMWGHEPETSVA